MHAIIFYFLTISNILELENLSFLCLLIFCTIFSDGSGRSGTFIAILILMEQLKLEHSIDVFKTIQKLRATRPEFVQNEVN